MENLRKLRTSLGKSQQEIAEYLGISNQAYSNYENGRREPDFNTLINLAKYFDVSVDCLLDYENSEGSSNNDLDIRMIQRARNNMSPQDREKMMKILKATFEEAFDDKQD